MFCTMNSFAVGALLQDLLVTQSDFVRSELMSLQQQLQALEERAHNIEADIRNSMSIGELGVRCTYPTTDLEKWQHSY